MKYKASVIIATVMVLALACTFVIGFRQVGESEVEGRALTTFDMVFHPVEDEDSVVYNANKNPSDRFEDAMKDQIRVRKEAVELYMDIDSYCYNLFDDAYQKVQHWLNDREKEKDPPETEPRESGEPGETSEPTDTEPPIVYDYEKYPGYGYARLEKVGLDDCTLKKLGSYYLINGTDWVGEMPNTSPVSEKEAKVVQFSIDQLTTLQEAYDIEVFGYMVSHARDTGWFDEYLDAEWVDRAEYVAQMAPESFHLARAAFLDFADYQTRNYKSDHHWTHIGSRIAYEEIYDMMSDHLDIGERTEPIKEWNFSQLYGVQYRGSRANGLQNAYKAYDEFVVYEYELGDPDCFVINPTDLIFETPVRLALWDEYKAGNISKGKYYDHYINFYGTATDKNGQTYADSKYIFGIRNFGNFDHNLLMVGDSNMRALRDVMATHFGTTIYLDYRIAAIPYIDELIEQYSIDTILIVSQRGGYWYSSSDVFTLSPEFEEAFNK